MNTAFAIRVLGMREKSHIGKGGGGGNTGTAERKTGARIEPRTVRPMH